MKEKKNVLFKSRFNQKNVSAAAAAAVAARAKKLNGLVNGNKFN